ncbi:30S ribosomal protein S13 [Candidatus Woesearchaeota archaeon]|nr:MAG: 30S ribosomal protein S13 [Candidatus Woesearchaeota archaeon]
MAEKDFKHIVRIANTDLKGEKGIAVALQKITGVGASMAQTVCALAKVNPLEKAGELTDDQINAIDTILADPQKAGIPSWYFNRQKDYETGVDKHIVGPSLKFEQENDVKRLAKIKSYRGLRHQWGLPVRGQRTQSNFRNKRKVGGAKRKR